MRETLSQRGRLLNHKRPLATDDVPYDHAGVPQDEEQNVTIAQAMLEKGALDGLAAGMVTVADGVQTAFNDYPWVAIGAIVLLLVILLRPSK